MYINSDKGDVFTGDLCIGMHKKPGKRFLEILPVGKMADGTLVAITGPTFDEGTVCQRLDAMDFLPEFISKNTFRIMSEAEIFAEAKSRIVVSGVLFHWLKNRGHIKETCSRRFNMCDSLSNCIDVQFDSGRLPSGVEIGYSVETPAGNWDFSVRVG